MKTEKFCKKCNTTRPLTDFFTNGIYVKKDGSKTQKYKPSCKRCEIVPRELASKQKVVDAVKFLGMKMECTRCGYNEHYAALTFHHLIPKEKSFNISSGKAVGREKLIEEMRKCIILCANCHNIEHVKYPEIHEQLKY